MMKWMIDKKIDLIATIEGSEMHLAKSVDSLISQGLNREDAEAFAEFGFNELSKNSEIASESLITEDQDSRLSFC